MIPRVSLAGVGLFAVLLASFGSALALNIEGNFVGGQQLGPSIGAGSIVDIFRAAADTWELAIRDDFTVTFDFGWGAEPGGTHTLLAQGGTPNRETHGLILVNPQVFADGSFATLFLDPTPTQNEEFANYSERTQDLGGGPVNVERRFSAPLGDPSVLFQDLFTMLAHEIGHGLGISNANASFIAESGDGNITVTEPLPFAGTTIPLASNIFGVTSHIDLSGEVGPLMGGWGSNDRLLPSSIDILANAQLSGFRELNLDLQPVPEPGTLLLLGSGLAGLGACAWRRRR